MSRCTNPRTACCGERTRAGVGDRAARWAADSSAVRDDADEILRRQRLEHRDEELVGVLVLAEHLL